MRKDLTRHTLRRLNSIKQMQKLLFNKEIYEWIFERYIPKTKKSIWIGTADIKNVHIPGGTSKKAKPFLEVLAAFLKKGIEVKLLHAKEPGESFRNDFDRFPVFTKSQKFERLLCPRVHFKSIIIDGKYAFSGSANLTGAGMGGKHADKRNFEFCYFTTVPAEVLEVKNNFTDVFSGKFCETCRRKEFCPDPIA
ncbi:MAG: phosphatidylserine synthase [bacterium]|nr:phosphatidylserine synthase [bacterium]